MERHLLTVVEAAEYLQCGVNTLYINARAGKVPHYKIVGAVRFDADELRAWVESNHRGPVVKAGQS